MSYIDLPMLLRTSVGFERLAELLHESLLQEYSPTFPPYNIERHGSDIYRITLAVPGYSIDSLEVILEQELLVIKGEMPKQTGPNTFLHKGINQTTFQKIYPLAQDIEVTDASLENGLLHIILIRKKSPQETPTSFHFSKND